MDADNAPALRTPILLLLLFEEFFHAMILDEPKVFNHAHIEPRSVALIKLLEVIARKVLALKAELDLSFGQIFTSLHYEGAVPFSWPATQTGGFSFLAIQPVAKVCHTYIAVHAARCNKLGVHA
jgi:hypothetical protein